MHYLKCIALLSKLRSDLFVGQRDQVKATQVAEFQNILTMIRSHLKNEQDPAIDARLDDLMAASIDVRNVSGLDALSETMKESILDGVNELYDSVCLKAYRYFQTHDFEPTEAIVKVMRSVVQVALDKGVL